MKKSPAARSAGDEVSKQALRKRAETRLARSPDIPKSLTPDEIREALHDLRVHQIELEMQNEELRAAQAEIEAGRARYFDLYDLAPVGYCTLSELGLIVEANLTAATLLGTSRGTLVTQRLSHFIYKEDQDSYFLLRKRLFESGESQECELRLLKPDGAVFWAHLTATAAQAEDGAPVCRVVLLDITERKRAEKDRFEMAERYRLANKATNDVIWDWDIVNDAQRWNEAGTAVFGWTDIVEAPQTAAWWMDRLHPEDWPRMERAFAAAVGNSAVSRWSDEYRFRKADGTYAFVVDRGYILRDAAGRAVRMIGAMLDITERKQAEEAQRETSLQLQESVRAANVGLWDWDLTTNRVRYSREWKRQIGYEDAEIDNAFEEWESRVHPEDLAPTMDAIREAITGTSRRYQSEFRFRHKDGSYRWIVAQCSVSRDETGKAVCVVGSHLDLTERKQAEEALRESEDRFSTAFRTSPFAISITRAKDGKFIEVNDAFTTMTGFSREDALSNSSLGLSLWMTMEDRDQVVNDLRAGRTVVGHEYPFRTRGEKTFMGSFSARAIVLGGEPCVLSCIEDITERSRAEVALREEHERLENVLSATRTGIDIVDGDFNLHYVDRGWQKVYGDPTGRKCYEYFNGLNAPCPGCGISKALATKQPVITDVVLPREGNRPIEVHILPFQNSEGQWLVAEINIDITDRKKAAEALIASEMRFKELLLQVPTVAVQGYSLDGTVRYWNHASETFYGYTAKEALDKNLLDLIVPPALRDYVRAAIRRMVETGETLPAGEVELMRKDGSLIPVYSAHALVHLPGQEPELFCLDIDLTERKKTEAEKEKLQAQFLQAQKMDSVGRLAGGVAHDFNNLLMGIMGYVELCLEELALDHPIRKYLDEITQGAERSAEITRQLLAFARKQTIAPKVLDLSDAVVGMRKLLQRLIGEDIQMTWRPGSGLPLVRIDPSQIDQILANLCVNARDAIAGVGEIALETGSVVIDTDYCAKHPEALPGVYVFLAVRDNGCGMDKATLAQVFEPFFTTKGLGKGTGLGLATVYGIVKQNNGFIRADSEPGKGTTFTIYLPEVAAEAESSVTPKAGAPRGRGETVLLVEDEKALRVTCGAFLVALGYEVLVAETPGEALKMVAGHPGAIHVLLTDVVMPGMDGWQLAQRLRAVKPGLKVLFMSGYTSDVIAQRGVLDEGVQFLSKPFMRDALARKVIEVLEAD